MTDEGSSIPLPAYEGSRVRADMMIQLLVLVPQIRRRLRYDRPGLRPVLLLITFFTRDFETFMPSLKASPTVVSMLMFGATPFKSSHSSGQCLKTSDDAINADVGRQTEEKLQPPRNSGIKLSYRGSPPRILIPWAWCSYMYKYSRLE